MAALVIVMGVVGMTVFFEGIMCIIFKPTQRIPMFIIGTVLMFISVLVNVACGAGVY